MKNALRHPAWALPPLVLALLAGGYGLWILPLQQEHSDVRAQKQYIEQHWAQAQPRLLQASHHLDAMYGAETQLYSLMQKAQARRTHSALLADIEALAISKALQIQDLSWPSSDGQSPLGQQSFSLVVNGELPALQDFWHWLASLPWFLQVNQAELSLGEDGSSLTLNLQMSLFDALRSPGIAATAPPKSAAANPFQALASIDEAADASSPAEIPVLRPEIRIIQVNHGRAEDLAALIRGDSSAWISPQGSLQVDPRNNTLFVRDVPEQLAQLQDLVARLDQPLRQVLIETRIVIAADDFARDLGVRLGVSARSERGRSAVATSGSAAGAEAIAQGEPVPLADRLSINLPAGGSAAGRIGLSILRPNILLDLELSALQAEGRGEIIATPRIITANGKTAVIKQGERLPYEESAESGNTTIRFIDAVLATEVTPHITADGSIILDIRVNKDNPGTREIQGTPSIETREVQTRVFVRNGETVVLGGIYEMTDMEQIRKIPFFGDLPGLGRLFRSEGRLRSKAELLVFVTPHIIDSDF
ncbi:type IV pilus secretin (or competence protein) PilQ [Ectothiorhodosinus mongolicus]|uniref:Type IV pilus secretin (Or competence protein) PilQ n=1 Tax=Ectothiorhodosinus mongolicus TaxID=233100 RepID=A0A1R3VV04_9GAMM|nr:type IV pilus secretin PilQ [Ectothiorhodosinus mongolicus]ULX56869.1 type IV pilus secretin PilQ [Ectothiorhodosinus mongolicus]SIT68734.1 type IV pilus secretin (or competence protein) PilQ [Ectothiorhodosinus mongolicus]